MVPWLTLHDNRQEYHHFTDLTSDWYYTDNRQETTTILLI